MTVLLHNCRKFETWVTEVQRVARGISRRGRPQYLSLRLQNYAELRTRAVPCRASHDAGDHGGRRARAFALDARRAGCGGRQD